MALARISLKSLKPLPCLVQAKRTYLSDMFNLRAEWNERLKAPVYANVDMEKYFLDIDRQFLKTGLTSHIDVDIFANGLLLSKDQGVLKQDGQVETRLEQMEELLRRFRATPEAIKMLDSTPHAIARACMDSNSTDIIVGKKHVS